MLKSMRRHAKYFYVLFGMVIVSFVFWGVGRVGNEESAKQPLIIIGKDKIYLDEYWRVYQNNENMMRELYPDKFDEKMRDDLKQKVLNDMISQRVLLHAARQSGIIISDREVEEAIVNDPSFNRQGGFRRDIYLRILEMNHMNAKEFEAMKRNSLMIEKMARLITDPVVLGPDDLPKVNPKMKVDEKTTGMLKDLALNQKKEVVLRSYVEGLKKKMEVKIRPELIS